MTVPRHAGFVRVTHWLTTIAFIALLLSGVEILLSHPRFYWGEVGNLNMEPLLTIPVPSSRAVPTGYGFMLPDQNGWSRYLHFQAAWLVLFTGGVYVLAALRTGHFRRNLVPASAFGDPGAYNELQRLTYLIVIFVLFPLVIWTGLAMAPGFTSVFPASVTLLGGRQSARTVHFFVTIALVFFTLVHLTMIILAGFRARVRAMITGSTEVRP